MNEFISISSLSLTFQANFLDGETTGLRSVRSNNNESLFEDPQVLMVDRDRTVLDRLEGWLKKFGFADIRSCFDAKEAGHLIEHHTPDLVLVDIAEGFDLLRSMRRRASLQAAGVIITGNDIELEKKRAALHLGANAFLTKPLDPDELFLSIRNIVASKSYQDHLSFESNRLAGQVQQRMFELEAARQDADTARQEAMQCLARAAEFRDTDTGNHVLRVGRYAAAVAKRFDFDASQIEMIEQAAHLHDVGKIGVSDTILLKPGKLTAEELEQMQHHCEYGGNIIAPMTDAEWGELLGQPNRTFEIIGNSSAPLMRLAALIALTHHEKWDGTGYPFGLHGEQIPLVGRITAIADVFDALSSERPYKEAFSVEKCFSIIREGRGNHFDPAVLDAFFDAEDEILAIKESLSD